MESTLSYVTTYMAIYFDFCPECIFYHLSRSPLVGDSIMDTKVYRGYVVSIFHRETLVDFIELDMMDFEVILGRYWL